VLFKAIPNSEAFDFTILDNYVFEHVFSYSKDEKRSTKQTYLSWAVKLQQELMALKVNADKFMKQIDTLICDCMSKSESLNLLLERTEAAEQLFQSTTWPTFSESIFEFIEAVKLQKQTKEYLAELLGFGSNVL
jgi:hypothetical protein